MNLSADINPLDQFFESLYENAETHGFSDFRAYPILLYGAGNLGKKLYSCLVGNGIQPLGFIDRNASRCSAPAPVFSVDTAALMPQYRDAVVILAGLFGRTQDREIRRILESVGFQHIYALHEINWQALESRAFLAHMFIGSYDPANLLRDERQIRAAYELFSTEE